MMSINPKSPVHRYSAIHFMFVKLEKLEKQKSKLILLKINIAIPYYHKLWFRDYIFAFQIFCF